MPRSSRHKSSKHSSRDVKEYSDSEKDSSLRDHRKGKEDSSAKVSKDSFSSEKHKLDTKDAKKDLYCSGNGKHSEEHGSSKRRKERGDDGAVDRWNGGGEDDRGEVSKRSKVSEDSKSKRRDESGEMHGDGEGMKRSSGKSEGRHRDSSRKEGRDGGRERERKGREGRSERVVDNDEQHLTKQVAENNTDSTAEDVLQSPGRDHQLEMQLRKKTDGSGDGNRRQDDVGNIDDRRLSSKDSIGKDTKHKDEKQKDERYKEKYRDDADRDSKHRDGKQRDDRPAKDHFSKSDGKYSRDEKDTTDIQMKSNKSQGIDWDRDGERDLDGGHDRDRDRYRGHDRDRDCDRDRHDHSRNSDRDRDHGRGRDWDRDYDRDRGYGRDGEPYQERDCDPDGLDNCSSKYKDSRGRKRLPDEHEDCTETKSRVSKAYHTDMGKKSLSSDRTESDAERGRSQSRPCHKDAFLSSNRRRASPSSISRVGSDEYRDSLQEQRSRAISSRELTGFSGVQERGAKYRSGEKSGKIDDAQPGDLLNEKSSSSKASPMGLVERSPSSTSIDRRYMNRSGVKRSLDIEEARQRNNSFTDTRELSSTDDRPNRDFPSERPLVDVSSQVDSSFYNRASQSNSTPPPPFVGSLEDDSRLNSSGRYRRNNDPNMGRLHGNAWRGVPNWTSPLPNGFNPFQHGPPHGVFQTMMPQFPTPPLFGVRPPLEITHSGMPYHIPDAERFSSHLRPLRWQSMIDGSGPSHLHGWDGNNGVFREEPHLYGGAEWDPNRHLINGRGWESSAEMWKGQNSDLKRDFPFLSHKDDNALQAPVDDVSGGEKGEGSHHEDSHCAVVEKTAESRPNVPSPAKEISTKSLAEPMHEEKPSFKRSNDDTSYFSRFYLSNLDISAELANPELYNKCLSLLAAEQRANADEENDIHIFLEGGARGHSSSNCVRRCSLFHPIKDSVFQRAMELYKKQRMETKDMQLVSGGALDVISASYKGVEREQVFNLDVEKANDPSPTSDSEMPYTTISVIDEKTDVISTLVEEKLKERVQKPNQETLVHENPVGPLPNFIPEKLDVIVSEQKMNPERGEDSISPDKVPVVTPITSSINGDSRMAINPEGEVSADFSEVKKVSLGDSISGPLFFPDGPPKACDEALIPGSNESESIILSRIHHSPESTH